MSPGNNVEYALYNATVAGNVAGGQGGGVANNSQKFELYNSIIAKNVSTSGAAPDVFHDGGETKICVSLIGDASGLFGADGVYANGYALLGDAANPLDPGFVDSANGDYTLTADSPAVDAGLAYWQVPETDLAGNERNQGNRVDLGAYELVQADFVGETETASTVVTTAFDVVAPCDGLISLREAIQYAASGATITFDPTVFAKKTTIEPAGLELLIDKSLTFVAPEVGVVLDAKKLSRIATVDSETSVAFDGFEFVNGKASGATAGSGRGGAIYASSYANLTVTNSSFANNEANSDGGAIYADKTALTVTDSTFMNNEANSDGGAIEINCLGNDGALTVVESRFDGNKAREAGAIYIWGVSSPYKTLVTVTGSTFTNNEAKVGGAIYVYFATFIGTNF